MSYTVFSTHAFMVCFSVLGIYRLILSSCCCLLLPFIDSRFWFNWIRATNCIRLVLEFEQFIFMYVLSWIFKGEDC